jgi:4-amino-4-deoxy-L-arabinose transferase-like glycosyltransferase
MLRAKRDSAVVFLVALATRFALALWAGSRFPAAADGFYYDTIARRIAHGEGYTWLWPDGAVTYAAHYPIGYPALLGLVYAVFGASPTAAMLANACLGAAGALAAHRLVLRATTARRAMLAALVVALHPALLPYTAAIMTEGVTSAVLVIAASLAAAAKDPGGGRDPASAQTNDREGWPWRAALGVALGGATLIRPQSLLMAPLFGALSARGRKGRVVAAAATTLLALASCAPWTIRNCVRMQRCALVSVNGGWNLLIGVESTTGAWSEVKVPEPCKTVWAEAQKDDCFGRAARDAIRNEPGRWFLQVPKKLAATFDYIGASPWYMHASNAEAFDERAKILHGAVETLCTRTLLLLSLLAAAQLDGERRRARWALAGTGAAFAVTLHAWVGYVTLALTLALLGRRGLARSPVLVSSTLVVVLATAATHAVFFGAGRYGLVVLPFVGALGAAGAFGLGAGPPALRRTPTPPLWIESRSISTSSGSSSRVSAR